jgi:hypothetical protein
MIRNDVASAGVDSTRAQSSLDFTGPLPVLLGALGCGLFALSLPPIPDHAYQFYLGQKLLDGATLYVDVAAADMHPPFFTWLAAALEGIARLFGTSGLSSYPTFVFLLVAASLYACWRIGPRSLFVLVVAMIALLPMAGPYLGQGEHLALVCALPYLAATAADQPRSRAARFFIALAAAVGLALKPHFALVALTTELYRARQHGLRSLMRLESITIAGFPGVCSGNMAGHAAVLCAAALAHGAVPALRTRFTGPADYRLALAASARRVVTDSHQKSRTGVAAPGRCFVARRNCDVCRPDPAG